MLIQTQEHEWIIGKQAHFADWQALQIGLHVICEGDLDLAGEIRIPRIL